MDRAASIEATMERSDGERKGERFKDLTKELGSRNTEDRHPSKPVIKAKINKVC